MVVHEIETIEHPLAGTSENVMNDSRKGAASFGARVSTGWLR
jgi:hypothetical protein